MISARLIPGDGFLTTCKRKLSHWPLTPFVSNFPSAASWSIIWLFPIVPMMTPIFHTSRKLIFNFRLCSRHPCEIIRQVARRAQHRAPHRWFRQKWPPQFCRRPETNRLAPGNSANVSSAACADAQTQKAARKRASDLPSLWAWLGGFDGNGTGGQFLRSCRQNNFAGGAGCF